MKRLFLLLLLSMLFDSCFTAKLLDKHSTFGIPADSYSLNRAYYTGDSMLNIDFTNNNSQRKKTAYYTVSFNIKPILKIYYERNEDIVYFEDKQIRKYGVLHACSLLRNCTGIDSNHYRGGILVDFKELHTKYSSSLPAISDSRLIKGDSILSVGCCGWPPTYEDDDDKEAEDAFVHKTAVMYFLPVGNVAGTYVALRFSLKGHRTKMGLLPVTILLDVATSPVQLAGAFLIYKLNHPGENTDGNNKSNNQTGKTAAPTKPIPKPEDNKKDDWKNRRS